MYAVQTILCFDVPRPRRLFGLCRERGGYLEGYASKIGSFQSSLLLFGQQERRGRSSKFNRVSLDIRSGGESSEGITTNLGLSYPIRVPGGRERKGIAEDYPINLFFCKRKYTIYRFVGRLQSSSRLYFCYYDILYT